MKAIDKTLEKMLAPFMEQTKNIAIEVEQNVGTCLMRRDKTLAKMQQQLEDIETRINGIEEGLDKMASAWSNVYSYLYAIQTRVCSIDKNTKPEPISKHAHAPAISAKKGVRVGGWTRKDEELLLAYYKQGIPTAQMAELLGRTTSAITAKYWALNNRK